MLIAITSASNEPIDGTVKATVIKTNTLNKTMDEVDMSPSWKQFLFQPKHKNIHTDGKVCYYDTEHVVDAIEVKDLEDAVLRFGDANDGLVVIASTIPGIAYECIVYDSYLE